MVKCSICGESICCFLGSFIIDKKVVCFKCAVKIGDKG